SKRKLIIVTSHDPTYFIRYTKSILLINRHKYFYGQASDVLRSDRLAEIYGVSSTHKLGDYSFIHDFHVCCR
ncbi:MAG: metal ABC transporter ATP-binding protein, partial [Thermoprotei archaeon]